MTSLKLLKLLSRLAKLSLCLSECYLDELHSLADLTILLCNVVINILLSYIVGRING